MLQIGEFCEILIILKYWAKMSESDSAGVLLWNTKKIYFFYM